MDSLTVRQVVSEYISFRRAQVQAGHIHQRHADKCQRFCRLFCELFGDNPLDKCRRGDIKRFLIHHPEWRSPHTQHDAAGNIVSCFRWAEEDGLISRCPYARPKDLPALQPRTPITEDEVQRMLAYCRKHGHRRSRRNFRLALWFLWETGCRTTEMRRLQWQHLNAEKMCFVMPGKTTRKTGRARIIALTRRAWRLIRWMRRMDLRGPEAHVFLNGVSKPWHTWSFSQKFRKIARLAGVRPGISGYCLRHGFTCKRLEAGKGERQIADALGHSTTKFVQWYGADVKNRVDYLRAAAELE